MSEELSIHFSRLISEMDVAIRSPIVVLKSAGFPEEGEVIVTTVSVSSLLLPCFLTQGAQFSTVRCPCGQMAPDHYGQPGDSWATVARNLLLPTAKIKKGGQCV